MRSPILVFLIAAVCLAYGNNSNSPNLTKKYFGVGKETAKLLLDQGKPIKTLDENTYEISQVFPFQKMPKGASTTLDKRTWVITAINSKENISFIQECLAPIPFCPSADYNKKAAEQGAAANP